MKNMRGMIGTALVGGLICIGGYNALKPHPSSHQQSIDQSRTSEAPARLKATPSTPVRAPETRAPLTFAGNPCTEDCSGHEAGYSWAEEHDIDDADDCDTAGENSNSPSFAEGCEAYVLENTPDVQDDATADDDDEESPDP